MYMEEQMSKSKKVSYDMTPYNDYLNYLKNYNTGNVDNTLNNLTSWASTASQNLGNTLGNYTFNIDASDEARQRAENATYNQYMDKLQPQFLQQTDDMATRLANQGLSVGSEAYQRAMNDLQDNQNEAVNQAAYQSVLAGQNAYSQNIQDQVLAGNFGNTAQQQYINQLLSALKGSASGYENQQNIFGVGTGKSALQYAQDKANSKNGWGSALGSIGGGALGAYFGGPSGAAFGSQFGGSLGSYFD